MIQVLKYLAAGTKTMSGPYLVNCNANGTL
jgi:hypothetical protein